MAFLPCLWRELHLNTNKTKVKLFLHGLFSNLLLHHLETIFQSIAFSSTQSLWGTFFGQIQTDLLPLQGVNEMCPVFSKAWWSTQLMVDIQRDVFICTTNLGQSAVCCFAQLLGNLDPKATLSGQRITEVKITHKNESGSVPSLHKHFSCATAQPTSPAVFLHPPLSYSSWLLGKEDSNENS